MESAVANRVFQGRENPAIAIARGRLRTNIEDPGAALRFFPAAKPLFSRYRELVSEKYPHLTVDWGRAAALVPASSGIDLAQASA